MTLTVTTKPLENRQLSLTIEVAEERIEQEMRKAARKIAQTVRIPGFRKGRAPFHILVQFLGREAIIREFVDELSQEVYKEALEQEGLEPYAMGNLNDIDMAQTVRFHLTLPLAPEARLGQYRSLRIEEEEVEGDEEGVQKRIEDILEQNAGYEDADRPSQYGDLLTIDMRGVILDDEGNETDTVVFDEEDWDVTPDQEDPMEPPGLDEALLGLTADEEKTFEIVWPEDSQSMYAGETVRFGVTVHRLQSYEMPAELTDEIAQNVGPEYETAADLLDEIRDAVLKEAKTQANFEYTEKVLDGLVAMSEIDYPPVAVELQIEQMVNSRDMQLRQMGLQGIEQYLEVSKQSMEEYRATLRQEAEMSLCRQLVLAEIAQSENLTVSDEEAEAHIEIVAGPLPTDADEDELKARADFMDMLRTGHSRPYVDEAVLSDKSIELVLAIARGEEIPESTAMAQTLDADGETQDVAPADVEESVSAEDAAEETTGA